MRAPTRCALRLVLNFTRYPTERMVGHVLLGSARGNTHAKPHDFDSIGVRNWPRRNRRRIGHDRPGRREQRRDEFIAASAARDSSVQGEDGVRRSRQKLPHSGCVPLTGEGPGVALRTGCAEAKPIMRPSRPDDGFHFVQPILRATQTALAERLRPVHAALATYRLTLIARDCLLICAAS